MLLRDFRCAVCGAPRRTTADAYVVMCVHCGAMLSLGSNGEWERVAERHADGIRSFAKPTRAAARQMELAIELAALTSPADREAWRLLSEEQAVIGYTVHPELSPPLPPDPAGRARVLRDAVVMMEIGAFDPGVQQGLQAYSRACMKLGHGDPVAVAKEMLAAATAYYRAYVSHPNLPLGAMREGAEHHARELVRQGISGYASLLGASTIERIRVEVLGDRVSSDCPRCGGPLEVAGLSKCRHCGAVLAVDDGDMWTKSQLAIWEISKKELLRRGDLDGPGPVIAALGGFLHTAARDVPVDRAFAFLSRVIPWVSAADFAQGLSILSHGGSPAQLLLLNGLAERTWTADPSARPPAHVARLDFAPPSAEEEAAWVAYTSGLWKMGGRRSLLDLLAYPLSTFQSAAVHETETSVTARAAMAFFEQAIPGFDRVAMLTEVRRLQPGYDHPRVAAFLSELAALL